MKLSEALVAISARLRADAAVSPLVGKEIHLDYPRDAQARNVDYVPAGNKPFIWFGAVAILPLNACGGLRADFRLYADSYAPDRREALNIMQAIIAALSEEHGADPFDGFSIQFQRGGTVLDPPFPKSTYADFQIIL